MVYMASAECKTIAGFGGKPPNGSRGKALGHGVREWAKPPPPLKLMAFKYLTLKQD